jgi:hypothetical protein
LKIWIVVLVLAMVACAKPAERMTWSKEGATATDLQHAEAECVNSAGIVRDPGPYAGGGTVPPRSADFAGRGRDQYIACMQSKGYTLAP